MALLPHTFTQSWRRGGGVEPGRTFWDWQAADILAGPVCFGKSWVTPRRPGIENTEVGRAPREAVGGNWSWQIVHTPLTRITQISVRAAWTRRTAARKEPDQKKEKKRMIGACSLRKHGLCSPGRLCYDIFSFQISEGRIYEVTLRRKKIQGKCGL